MSARTEPKPWDRAKGESAKVFNYFQIYLRLGPKERSFGKTSAEVRCSQRNIERIAARWKWTERVDAWDRFQDAINFERFERMRGRAARRRLERQLQRQEEAGAVGDLMLGRVRQMLAWPIQEEITVEKTEVTPDGQHLHIHQRIIKPCRWDMNTVVRLVDVLDKIRRSSVVDATKEKEPEGIPPSEIAERHFILHTAEQVQQPKTPEADTTEPPKDGDRLVDTGEEGVHGPLEQHIGY